MTGHDRSPEGLERLTEFMGLAPQEFQAAASSDRTIGREGGAIGQLHRELTAVGVAVRSPCPYCLEVHVTRPEKARASKAQLAEAVLVAAGLGAGAAVIHGTMAARISDEA
ncbi:carboxymuconolactone decarboxylase family protein [Kocuria sp. M4R2S49]|uniref:carboxymuconolactone decarboxylase family protein n=1 Tax=Kocuria rhizosphaericola TaxID=3376284 RepID=UPI00379C26EA